MNYIGSKRKLASFLNDEIRSTVGNDLSQMVFCDLFAGTGAVGRQFKSSVKSVIANDIESYSFTLNRHYIANHTTQSQPEHLIAELNALPLITDGFIFTHYCSGGASERLYFSDYNGQKIDTIRSALEQWKSDGIIDDDCFYFLLTSLLESADKVANTASVYGAYLKKLKKSAQKELVLELAHSEITANSHSVYNEDCNDLISSIEGDILYLDPPYNQRQYGANYHLLNTIALYDEFEPQGKTGLRQYNRSNYCKKREVSRSFEALISEAKFKYIFLSYNNEGLMSESEVESIMKKYGSYRLAKKKYQRFKADKTENRNHKADSTFELLHILVKDL